MYVQPASITYSNLVWDNIQAVRKFCNIFFVIILSKRLEPVGSVPPKMNLLEKVRTMQVPQSTTYAMQCPGQAFPVPIVRYVFEAIIDYIKGLLGSEWIIG